MNKERKLVDPHGVHFERWMSFFIFWCVYVEKKGGVVSALLTYSCVLVDFVLLWYVLYLMS